MFYKKKTKVVFKQYKKRNMTKMITQNKKMLPTMANWRKEGDTWIHKDEPRNLRGNALETYKKTLHLTQQQKDILIGSLLGDGYIHFHRSTKQPTYGFCLAQTWYATDYVEHMYQVFKPFVGTPPKINLIGGIKQGLPNRYEARFKTYSHNEFKYYYDLFYPANDNKRIKRVPKNIGELLTARSLAYWFMEDGARGPRLPKSAAYFISTHSFSYDDQLVLVNALEKNFGIQSVLHKDKEYFRLSIKPGFRHNFYNLIKPFIHSYFEYKL